ncbi:MAG: hypothetical protein ACK52I_00825 [Pseudomonadota bacterium]|jgi:hypothetical protein
METKFIKGTNSESDIAISLNQDKSSAFMTISIVTVGAIGRTSLYLNAAGLRELARETIRLANEIDPPKVDGTTETSYEDYLDWMYHNNAVAK